ncbi:GFA family protein, partial [Phyllobacterium sp. P5_D12]
MQKRTGRCACGAVRFGFDIDPDFVAVCHCRDCKRASGGEAMTLLGVSEDEFAPLSGQPKAFHYTASSGKGLDRNFCPACGTRLFTSNAESYLD